MATEKPINFKKQLNEEVNEKQLDDEANNKNTDVDLLEDTLSSSWTYSSFLNNIEIDNSKYFTLSRLPNMNITTDDEEVNGNDSSKVSLEDIECLTNLERDIIYPPDPLFLGSYKMWHLHQQLMWTSHESDFATDEEYIKNAPIWFKNLLGATMALLMHGDTVVLSHLSSKALNNITARAVKVFFADQEARENVHQEVYSLGLNIILSEKANYYRSNEFKIKYMGRFYRLVKKYTDTVNVRIYICFVMLCEIILFAPLFQIVCYASYAGYIRLLGDANIQVMRDEALHYDHARLLMSQFKYKLSKNFLIDLLNEFKILVIELMEELVGDNSTEDNLLNINTIKGHFNHVCHGFMKENNLYKNKEEEINNDALYGISPAEIYLRQIECFQKINLMEAQATTYTIKNHSKPIDMSRDWD